jgi:hypothetical protein
MSVLQAITHPADTGTMGRHVVNIGILLVSEVDAVVIDDVRYRVDPPQREPGYYAVEVDESDGVAHLIPTSSEPDDQLVRRWTMDPEPADRVGER